MKGKNYKHYKCKISIIQSIKPKTYVKNNIKYQTCFQQLHTNIIIDILKRRHGSAAISIQLEIDDLLYPPVWKLKIANLLSTLFFSVYLQENIFVLSSFLTKNFVCYSDQQYFLVRLTTISTRILIFFNSFNFFFNNQYQICFI